MNSPTQAQAAHADPNREALQALIGQRLGPYRSFNPVSRTQVWQWCSAMGDRSPLYLDDGYRETTEFTGHGVVAPPAMMQMWTMRDVNMEYAPGSSEEHPYPIMRDLEARGFPENVAISYDIHFHRYLVEGDRVHHYKSVVDISALKSTTLGQGYFFSDRMEYLDQNGELFAEALITYFQYRAAPPASGSSGESSQAHTNEPQAKQNTWQPDYADLHASQVNTGEALPELVIPITHKLIVAGAIATQDFIPVHHNVPAAQAAAMPDIFMNILTTCGLCARYLGDWAGPGSRLKRLQLTLMAPNTPGDTLVLQGKVNELTDSTVSVEFTGNNSLGPHVMGSASLVLAD